MVDRASRRIMAETLCTSSQEQSFPTANIPSSITPVTGGTAQGVSRNIDGLSTSIIYGISYSYASTYNQANGDNGGCMTTAYFNGVAVGLPKYLGTGGSTWNSLPNDSLLFRPTTASGVLSITMQCPAGEQAYTLYLDNIQTTPWNTPCRA